MFERPTLVNKFLDKISKEHRSEINNRSQIRNKKIQNIIHINSQIMLILVRYTSKLE